MATPRGFRFSTNFFGLTSRADFTAFCRRVEELGYDMLFAADHLGSSAPFQMVVAAAAVTSRLRVGTLVLNMPFWNPALLAREITTADMLTEGRLEVGLGSGHMKWEFDEAGIAFEPFGKRADMLEAAIAEMGRIFAAGGYQQRRALEEHFGLAPLRPAQKSGFGGHGPPLLVGGTGDRILSIAARHADVVAVAGTKQALGKPPGTFRLCTAQETDERVAFTRAAAGDRAGDLEWQVLVQFVKVTDDRRAVAEQLRNEDGETMTIEEVMEAPYVLFGTVDEMADQVLRNRDRYGFTHYTVHGPFAEEFGPVMERVRSRTS
jgi:probable F420-dependent oxidoreductase